MFGISYRVIFTGHNYYDLKDWSFYLAFSLIAFIIPYAREKFSKCRFGKIDYTSLINNSHEQKPTIISSVIILMNYSFLAMSLFFLSESNNISFSVTFPAAMVLLLIGIFFAFKSKNRKNELCLVKEIKDLKELIILSDHTSFLGSHIYRAFLFLLSAINPSYSLIALFLNYYIKINSVKDLVQNSYKAALDYEKWYNTELAELKKLEHEKIKIQNK